MNEGVQVLAVGRDAEALEELAAASQDRIATAVCDMRDTQAVESLPARALDAFGRLDIVVNNAGIAPAGAFLEATAGDLSEVFAINVIAPALLARAAGSHFVAQQSGKVINVASISGIRGKATLVAYSASKGALIQLTRALAAEWAPYGVQINAIAPGAFATDAQAAVRNEPDLLERRLRKIPARRMALPREVGPLLCYLASPLSDFVTGSVVVIDGGETAKI
jgi:2-deoxy-D-gluconate 3-dehydrogenase